LPELLNVDSLMNTIDTLSNIYDAIRIINPVTKKYIIPKQVLMKIY
jgi:hypothetical protein